MRIKLTVVPNYYANSHIPVYFRPAYVLNTGKWNEESTDYYSNIIEESTHLTPGRGNTVAYASSYTVPVVLQAIPPLSYQLAG